MTTMTAPEIPLSTETPAERLRRVAAAVRVHFTWWGVHKTLTAQQKEEVGLACSADARLLTAGKKLIDVRNSTYRKLTSLRSRIVSYWRGLTLPYVEAGVRLIRQSDIDAFNTSMQNFRTDLAAGETDLNIAFEQLKVDARRRLGRLYNPADYPEEIRNLFGVDWDFPSVEPPNYLMRLNPDVYWQEQERVSQRFEQAVQLAEQAFLGEFSKLVAHLAERLSTDADGEKKVFRDSAIANLLTFFERFKQLNVRSNVQLDELVEQAKRIVQGVEAQGLRDNGALRQQVATRLAGVQAGLDGMLVDRPRRRIVRNQEAHP